MDPQQNKNSYTVNSNKDNAIYDSYVRTPCTQQSESSQNRPQNQYFLQSYVSNNMPQQLMYNSQTQPMYNIMCGSQPIYRNQNTCPVTSLNSYSQPVDPIPWVPDSCVPNSELASKDKYENKLKETNSSCCGGRIDGITCSPLSGVYKTVNKNFYYNKNSIMDSHWFYSSNYDNQKYSELPSCSRITPDNTSNIQCCDTTKSIKSVKYCSIQKYPEADSKLFMYSNKYDNNTDMFLTKDYSSCSQLTNISQACNLYNKDMNHGYFPTNDSGCATATNVLDFQVPKLDKTTEESNGGGGESDIVVEDSEEEVTDDSDDVEKDESQVCFVCNTTSENQFYVITTESPLTSYSHSPVYKNLTDLLEIHENTSNTLCQSCMNLVNTADNLQVQLNAIKQDLMSKNKTFKLYVNKTEFNIKSFKKQRPRKRKFKSRDVCGIHSFKCSVCEKIFSLKKFYLFHMAKHKTKSKYLCEHCGCNFIKHSNLLAHLRKHGVKSKKGKKIFVCHICGKIFKTRTNLQEHEHFCSGNLPFKCNSCDRRFPSSTKLKQHIQLTHEKMFTATCPICDKGFIKQSDLKAHSLTHSGDKNFPCTKCDKMYKTLSNLNQHLKSHDERLPYICTICLKGFVRKESFQTHLNLHNGVTPFACSICDKKFASQKNLDAHLKIHNGTAKLKTCSICGKQIRHGLQDHMRTHSNVKELECDVCAMKFLTKSALAKHRKRKHDNMDVDVM